MKEETVVLGKITAGTIYYVQSDKATLIVNTIETGAQIVGKDGKAVPELTLIVADIESQVTIKAGKGSFIINGNVGSFSSLELAEGTIRVSGSTRISCDLIAGNGIDIAGQVGPKNTFTSANGPVKFDRYDVNSVPIIVTNGQIFINRENQTHKFQSYLAYDGQTHTNNHPSSKTEQQQTHSTKPTEGYSTTYSTSDGRIVTKTAKVAKIVVDGLTRDMTAEEFEAAVKGDKNGRYLLQGLITRISSGENLNQEKRKPAKPEPTRWYDPLDEEDYKSFATNGDEAGYTTIHTKEGGTIKSKATLIESNVEIYNARNSEDYYKQKGMNTHVSTGSAEVTTRSTAPSRKDEFIDMLDKELDKPYAKTQQLYLRHIPLDSKRVKQLADYLNQHHIQLSVLVLNDCNLQEETLSGIYEILKQQSHLDRVVLSNNSLGNPGSLRVLKELVRSVRMNELSVVDTGLDTSMASAIVDKKMQVEKIRFSDEIGLGIEFLIKDDGFFRNRVLINLHEPIDKVKDLIYAARNDKLNQVEELLKAGVPPYIATDTGMTPLLAASAAGHWSIVERLLQEKGIDVNAVDSEQEKSALHYAVQFNSEIVVDRLIQAGANPTITDKNGITPLDLAIHDSRESLVTKLVKANGKTSETFAETNQYEIPLTLANLETVIVTTSPQDEFTISLKRLLAAPRGQRQILDLSNRPLTVEQAEQLKEFINKHDIQLREFILSNAGINEATLPIIIAILRQQSKLDRVVLNNNAIGKTGCLELLADLVCYTLTQELSLENIGLSEQSAHRIKKWMDEGTLLEILRVSDEIGLAVQAMVSKERSFKTRILVNGSEPVANQASPGAMPFSPGNVVDSISSSLSAMSYRILTASGLVATLDTHVAEDGSTFLDALVEGEKIIEAEQNSILIEGPTFESTGHGLYDYASWSDVIEKHPQTGEDIFTWTAYKNNEETGSCEEVGHVKFYFNKLWCISEDKSSDNIVSTSGIFTENRDAMLKFAKENLIDTCGKLPPTLLERLESSATRGALSGAAMGISNVVAQGMVQNGYSKQAASYTEKALRCALMYAICFNQRLQKLAAGEASLMLVSLEAGVDTGMFMFATAMIDQYRAAARWASRKAQENGYSRSSQLLRWMGNLGQFGTHIYNAVTNDVGEAVNGVMEAGTSITTSITAQKTVEIVGQHLLGLK